QSPPNPGTTLFPYTTLFRSRQTAAIHSQRDRLRGLLRGAGPEKSRGLPQENLRPRSSRCGGLPVAAADFGGGRDRPDGRAPRTSDRKSTRLNSSHVASSYAV